MLRARNAVFAILLASALWTSLPQLVRLATEPVPRDPLYDSLQKIRAELAEGEAVGLSLRDAKRDMANAVFANYYLYPHPTRLYASLDDYRVLLLVDRNVPKKLVWIGEDARLMSYLEVRHEEVAASPVVRDPRAASAPLREFLVPMALAIDGQPGNSYVTDGVLLSDVDATATVTFFPNGDAKTFSLRAGQPLVVRDAVYAVTSRFDAGWLRVTATAPVRASFWFVSRGTSHAVSLPLFEHVPPLPQHVAGGEKFWILNPDSSPAAVTVNGEPHVIAAHALTQVPARTENEVNADRPVLAFSADKVNARERFHWPEGVR